MVHVEFPSEARFVVRLQRLEHWSSSLKLIVCTQALFQLLMNVSDGIDVIMVCQIPRGSI